MSAFWRHAPNSAEAWAIVGFLLTGLALVVVGAVRHRIHTPTERGLRSSRHPHTEANPTSPGGRRIAS